MATTGSQEGTGLLFLLPVACMAATGSQIGVGFLFLLPAAHGLLLPPFLKKVMKSLVNPNNKNPNNGLWRGGK